jgi:hypothetical protein
VVGRWRAGRPNVIPVSRQLLALFHHRDPGEGAAPEAQLQYREAQAGAMHVAEFLIRINGFVPFPKG